MDALAFMLVSQVRIVKHDRFSQGNVNVMFNFYRTWFFNTKKAKILRVEFQIRKICGARESNKYLSGCFRPYRTVAAVGDVRH